jgi:hypothetical protein
MSPSPSHLKRRRPGTSFGIFVPLSEEEAEDLLLDDEDDSEDDYDDDEVSEDHDDWDEE